MDEKLDRLKSLTEEELELEQLAAIDLALELARKRAEMLERLAARRAGTPAKVHEPELESPPAKPAVQERSALEKELQRLPLGDAISEYLKSCGEKDQSVEEIADALTRAGRVFQAENPVVAVRSALKKLQTKHDSVVHFGWGRWNLRSNYSEATLDLLLRSQRDHSARTKVGLERRREKGLPVGQPLKLTAEQYTAYLGLRRGGMSKRDAIRAIGMSVGSIYNYEARFDLDSWSPGDPWPPPEKGRQPDPSAEEPENVVRFAKASNE